MTLSTQRIDLVSNKLKMIRPNAILNPTEMVCFQPWRRMALKKVMSKNQLPHILKTPVAIGERNAQPQGAAICSARINTSPESCSCIRPLRANAKGIARLKPTAIVQITETVALNGTRTIKNGTVVEHLEPPIPGVMGGPLRAVPPSYFTTRSLIDDAIRDGTMTWLPLAVAIYVAGLIWTLVFLKTISKEPPTREDDDYDK